VLVLGRWERCEVVGSGCRWVGALVGFEARVAGLGLWDCCGFAVLVAEVVSWSSYYPRLVMDVGLVSLVADAGAGWEDVECSEGLDRVDRNVAHRIHSHMGDGCIRLGGLALRRLGRDGAMGRMHNCVGERHRHEDMQEEGEVAWCMVRRQPWEIESRLAHSAGRSRLILGTNLWLV